MEQTIGKITKEQFLEEILGFRKLMGTIDKNGNIIYF
jgi:hypothetical protein